MTSAYLWVEESSSMALSTAWSMESMVLTEILMGACAWPGLSSNKAFVVAWEHFRLDFDKATILRSKVLDISQLGRRSASRKLDRASKHASSEKVRKHGSPEYKRHIRLCANAIIFYPVPRLVFTTAILFILHCSAYLGNTTLCMSFKTRT